MKEHKIVVTRDSDRAGEISLWEAKGEKRLFKEKVGVWNMKNPFDFIAQGQQASNHY